METFSALLAIYEGYWTFVKEIHRSPVDFPHKGPVTWTFDVTSLLVWTNGWINTRFGNSKHHDSHLTSP